MQTIVFMAHPDVESSSSQQFLYQTMQDLEQVTFVDLQAEYDQQSGVFDVPFQQERLMRFDRIIFQFPLYWYQAPAILKIWLDSVFEEESANSSFGSRLRDKELGVVVSLGVKASHYQAGGREGVTISALLSPFQAFARHFGLTYLMPFAIHQFAYSSQEDLYELFWRYRYYLMTGKVGEFQGLQNYLLKEAEGLTDQDLKLTDFQEAVWESFLEELHDNAEELENLNQLMEDW